MVWNRAPAGGESHGRGGTLNAAIAGFRAMAYTWGLLRALHHAAGSRNAQAMSGSRWSDTGNAPPCARFAGRADDRRVVDRSCDRRVGTGAAHDHVACLLGAAEASRARWGAARGLADRSAGRHDAARSARHRARCRCLRGRLLGRKGWRSRRLRRRSWRHSAVPGAGDARTFSPLANLSTRELDVSAPPWSTVCR